MKIRKQRSIWIAICFLAAFVLWTAGVHFIDVQSIGPNGSSVGLATVNRYFHNLIGVHMFLYTITDWLGLVPFGFMLAFSILGLIQWIKRKHILKVDRSILFLGIFYLIVLSTYLLFEHLVVNYRPILINGFHEASYPSSTTMLTLCVMPTTWMQLRSRIRKPSTFRVISITLIVFMSFMVIARLVSGVHWLSDIIGGCLLSIGLDMLYLAASKPILTQSNRPMS